MLWTIFVILLVMWALGLVTSYTLGGFVHILLVIALVILVVNLVQGRRIQQAFRLCDEARNLMRINPITLVGIALIVLGIVAFAYKGITYTSREKIIDIGPIQATADTQKTIPLSPLLGGLALVGGIVLVVVGAKKT